MKIDITPRGISTIVSKNLALIGLIVAVALCCALFYFLTATNIYQSRATLLVRFGSDVRPELQLEEKQIQMPSSRDERREIIESHLRILQSRDYAKRLVDEFGVATLYPDLVSSDPDKAASVEEAAVTKLRDAIAVKSGTQTNILELFVFHPDSDLALRLLTRLIEMYVATQADLYENPQLQFIRSQMEAALASLTDQQQRLNDIRQQTGIFAYDQQFGLLLTQQDSISNMIFGLDARAAEADGKQQRLKAVLGSVPSDIASGTEAQKAQELQDLGNALDRLRLTQSGTDDARLAELERQYQDKLKEVQALNEGRSNRLNQDLLADFLRSTVDGDAARKARLYWQGERAKVETQIREMQTNNQAVVNLTRNTELTEATYRALKRQYDDASVSQKLNDERITRVTVIDAPFADPRPARPRKFLTLVGALIGSILLAAIIVFLKEALSDRIYLPGQLEQALRLKVIASFGRADRRAVPA